MSIGAGIIEGESTALALDIRPGEEHHIADSGVVFNSQSSSNVAFYETQNEGDTIDFSLPPEVADFGTAVLQFYTVWGQIDFDVQTLAGDTLIAEQSGFDSDVWFVTLPGDVDLRLTDFDTGAGVDGQQAAIYPYVSVAELQ